MRNLVFDRTPWLGATLAMLLSADAWATIECTEGGFSLFFPSPTPAELRTKYHDACVRAKVEGGGFGSREISFGIDLKCKNTCGSAIEGTVSGRYDCVEDRWIAFYSASVREFGSCGRECYADYSSECDPSHLDFVGHLEGAYARLRAQASLSGVSESIGKVSPERDTDVHLTGCYSPGAIVLSEAPWADEGRFQRSSSFRCKDSNGCVYPGDVNLNYDCRFRPGPFVGDVTDYRVRFDPTLSPPRCRENYLSEMSGPNDMIDEFIASSWGNQNVMPEADECQDSEEDQDSDSDESPSPAGPAISELVEDEVESTGVRMPGPDETFLATLAADAATRTTGRASYGYLSEKPTGGRFVLTSVLTGPPEKKDEPLTLIPLFHQNRAKGGGMRNRDHWARLGQEFVDNSGPDELGLGGLVITRTSLGDASATKKDATFTATREESEFLATRLAHLLGGNRLAWESPEAGSGKSALILLPSRKRLPITLKQFRKTAPPAPPALLEAGTTFELLCTPPATPAAFTLDSCEWPEKVRFEPIYVPAVARPELTSDHGMIEWSESDATSSIQTGC